MRIAINSRSRSCAVSCGQQTSASSPPAATITDACTKKILGWEVSATVHADDPPLQAFNSAAWQSNTDLAELIHHSDRGSQYLSLAYIHCLVELGIAPSVGSRGDSDDNALAESVSAANKMS